MIRIIIDSQSNRLFRGVAFEQAYDQRGGLCQIGEEGILITTNPIDPAYLAYWQSLGFSLPHMLTVGPFDERCTLSQLLMRRIDVQAQLKAYLRGREARLEFFCIEESERELSKMLGIPAYCDFDVAIELARKPAFKRFFLENNVPTPPSSVCTSIEELEHEGKKILERGLTFLVKAEDGTGGIACEGMFQISTLEDLQQFLEAHHFLGSEFVIEEVIDRTGEVSIHWEIDQDKHFRIIGIFNQFSPNFGYAGTSWPANISKRTRLNIEEDVRERIWPALARRESIGCFCGDIVIDQNNKHYWIDLNPRKGAIRYVYDLAQRIADLHFDDGYTRFQHEHLHLPDIGKRYSFEMIRKTLGALLIPNRESFLIVSNPGVIPYGYVDITSIAGYQGDTTTQSLLAQAKKKLLMS